VAIQQAAQAPVTHRPEAQSPSDEHRRPLAQAGQVPPQSTSPSAPFLTPSAQVGLVHSPSLHTPDTQSAAAPQAF